METVIDQTIRNDWALYNGDSCEIMPMLPDNIVGFSIFSPPFSNLYVYSDSERDMGNCKTDEEFFEHFGYIISELYRITIPGRLAAIHCVDLPLHKFKDGVVGLKDFPGQIIAAFQNAGWIYHSRVTIWKDPVIEMTRTKALGLLHKQICKDSTQCRQGCADYLIVMRKPVREGDQEQPVSHPNGLDPKAYIGTMSDEVATSVEVWQRYASPVWFDIRQTNVLNASIARSDKDERHICPLQLDVIERSIQLWSNPGDIIFSPFAGIGSEVYSAIKMHRKGIGIELKPEYYAQAVKNCTSAELSASRKSLLAL